MECDGHKIGFVYNNLQNWHIYHILNTLGLHCFLVYYLKHINDNNLRIGDTGVI